MLRLFLRDVLAVSTSPCHSNRPTMQGHGVGLASILVTAGELRRGSARSAVPTKVALATHLLSALRGSGAARRCPTVNARQAGSADLDTSRTSVRIGQRGARRECAAVAIRVVPGLLDDNTHNRFRGSSRRVRAANKRTGSRSPAWKPPAIDWLPQSSPQNVRGAVRRLQPLPCQRLVSTPAFYKLAPNVVFGVRTPSYTTT